MTSTYRIAVTDDHPMVRQNLKRILGGKKDFEVVGEAGDGLELLNFLSLSRALPHLVLLDITMPKLSGLEAARRIKRIYPDVKILILTIHKEKEYLDQAISAGAEGYLLKDDADTELFSAIEKIRQGGWYISPSLVVK